MHPLLRPLLRPHLQHPRMHLLMLRAIPPLHLHTSLLWCRQAFALLERSWLVAPQQRPFKVEKAFASLPMPPIPHRAPLVGRMETAGTRPGLLV